MAEHDDPDRLALLQSRFNGYDLDSPTAPARLRVYGAILAHDMPALMDALDSIGPELSRKAMALGGWTPLMAAQAVRWEAGKLALARAGGANIDGDGFDFNPLRTALGCGDWAAIEHILALGARLDLLDRHGVSCLHIAAGAHDPKVFLCLAAAARPEDLLPLLEQGPHSSGITPLGWAASRGKPEPVAWLLRHGAEVDSIDKQGRTPLHHVIYQSKDADCLRQLIAAGADMRHEDADGDDSLLAALHFGSRPLVEILLAAGADPRHRTSFGTSACLDSQRSDHPAAMAIRKWSEALDLRDALARSCPHPAARKPPPCL